MGQKITVRCALWLWLVTESAILYWLIGDFRYVVTFMLLIRLVAMAILSAYVSFFANPKVLSFKQWLYLYLKEWWASVLFFLILQLLPKSFYKNNKTIESKHVILVHGFFCNVGMWPFFAARLRAKGFSVSYVEMASLFGSLTEFAGMIDKELTRVRLQRPGVDVSVIGFSMGGLAGRYCLSHLTAMPFNLITVHSPHQGTRLARYAGVLGSVNGQQMTPGSDWLQALTRVESNITHRHFCSIWSTNDTIVIPAESADFGVHCIVECGKGHLYAAIDRSLHEMLIEQLNSGRI